MCWVALDRAVRAGRAARAAGDRVTVAGAVRDEIPQPCCARAGTREAGALHPVLRCDRTRTRPNLMMPIVGFLPADDPRVLATIDAIEARLTDQRGLVYRYRTDGGVDGLAGGEGTFLLCTFWLAHALAMAGPGGAGARRCSSGPSAYVNDVGPAGRGGRPGHRRAARQLPAGVQPHRTGQRRMGDQRSAPQDGAPVRVGLESKVLPGPGIEGRETGGAGVGARRALGACSSCASTEPAGHGLDVGSSSNQTVLPGGGSVEMTPHAVASASTMSSPRPEVMGSFGCLCGNIGSV